ncbi:hypothetical protein SEMRO_207_G086750.1 [Seminavis robusta]|uniref:Uncharacterized protein n=1 Tax=Seminavis robusta TaxID=568900 RepID=A0A9N8DM15_9STRA|nr:hypothetical protein SEMRO_207_G086750.1 [Seminavis robusta]|eukprot:Sro207_g086750.1 n/a (177) ;mRNA; r:10479-11009
MPAGKADLRHGNDAPIGGIQSSDDEGEGEEKILATDTVGLNPVLSAPFRRGMDPPETLDVPVATDTVRPKPVLSVPMRRGMDPPETVDVPEPAVSMEFDAGPSLTRRMEDNAMSGHEALQSPSDDGGNESSVLQIPPSPQADFVSSDDRPLLDVPLRGDSMTRIKGGNLAIKGTTP